MHQADLSCLASQDHSDLGQRSDRRHPRKSELNTCSPGGRAGPQTHPEGSGFLQEAPGVALHPIRFPTYVVLARLETITGVFSLWWT